MKLYSPNKKNCNLLNTCRTSKEPLLNKYETDERDCTRSTDNKKHVRCGDLQNTLDTQRRHALPVPLMLPPPSSPSLTSSHSSSAASASEPSTSYVGPPSCLTDNNVGEMMELSSSQKETKESLEECQEHGIFRIFFVLLFTTSWRFNPSHNPFLSVSLLKKKTNTRAIDHRTKLSAMYNYNG